jgi:hypothetical protein
MRNLSQFNARPEVFTKYLKDEKGLDLTGDSNIVKLMMVFAGLIFAGLGGWWLYNHFKIKKSVNYRHRL